jgi:ferredoxin
MRIRVDPDRCQGHTQCNFTAPQLLRLRDEDGHAEAIVDEVPPELHELARAAADSCPEQAIVLSEETGGADVV